eukprot:395280_1
MPKCVFGREGRPYIAIRANQGMLSATTWLFRYLRSISVSIFIKFLERYDGPPISQNEMEDRLGFQKKGGRIAQMTWAKMKYDVHVEQQSDPPDVRERSASPPPLLRSKRKSAMKKHSGNWSTLVAVKELEGRETTRTEVTELSARIFKKCNNGSPPTRLLQGANLRELIR